MTEGNGPVKTKRTGARVFKNPPQPHMCIRDSLKGSPDPCYINVLSWDKVALGMSSEFVPLYGGMKVWPPRTEKKDVAIFAVMANPEILKMHGKNARNPKERSWLIEILMDFVEKMNEGVTFNRRYTVLRDRDITGELKEIWMVVQSERAKAQQMAEAEELRRPVPQYPYYQEQQHPQHHQPQPQLSMPQHHQHPSQLHHQQISPHSHDEHPQFHSRVYYSPETADNCDPYDPNNSRQNVIITANDRKYLQYENNVSRVERYVFREPVIVQNPQMGQQNCVNYGNFAYQQLSRPIGPPFPTNAHPTMALNCANSVNPVNPMNIPVRPDNSLRYEKSPMANFYDNYHRMPQPPTMQPQLSQIQMLPTCYYETNPNSVGPGNFLQIMRPQENRDAVGRSRGGQVVRTKTNVAMDCRETNVAVQPPPPPPPPFPPQTGEVVDGSSGQMINSLRQTPVQIVPTCYYDATNVATGHFLQILRPQENIRDNGVKRSGHPGRTKTTVTIDNSSVPPTPPPLPPSNDNVELSSGRTTSSSRVTTSNPVSVNVSTTDVGNENCSVNVVSTLKDTTAKKGSTMNFLKLFRPHDVDASSSKDGNSGIEGNDVVVGDGKDVRNDETSSNFQRTTTNSIVEQNFKKSGKPKIKVLKRNKSSNDQKSLLREAKILINGDVERFEDSRTMDGTSTKDSDANERIEKVIGEAETNGIVDKQRTDSTKNSKTATTTATTTTTLRNTLKIIAGSGSADDTGNKKKTNGQAKSTSGKDGVDQVLQVYTILRKPEATTSRDDGVNDLSKLSLKDCGDGTSEVGTVVS